jgi:hypothetical protein
MDSNSSADPAVHTTRRGRVHYEDAPEYPADAYTVAGWGAGIAFRVYGWEVEPDEDTDWSGYYARTGRLVVVMVGDDTPHRADPEDVAPLDDDDFCHVCGQVGCTHHGRSRE